MHIEEMAAAIGRAHGAALDEVSRALWAAHAAGQVTDDEAESLAVVIEARRRPSHSARAMIRFTQSEETPEGLLHGGANLCVTQALISPDLASSSRKVPRCPKRVEARERSRRWAAAGRMPPAIAAKFTSGEQAALAVVAVEVTKRKACSMAIGAVAALAGVSESTVKRAIRQARALGFLTVQERRLSRYRNDTNIIRIISKAWTYWLELRGSGGGVQRCTGTNTSGLREGGQSGRQANSRAPADSQKGLNGFKKSERMGSNQAVR